MLALVFVKKKMHAVIWCKYVNLAVHLSCKGDDCWIHTGNTRCYNGHHFPGSGHQCSRLYCQPYSCSTRYHLCSFPLFLFLLACNISKTILNVRGWMCPQDWGIWLSPTRLAVMSLISWLDSVFPGASRRWLSTTVLRYLSFSLTRLHSNACERHFL